LINIFVLEYYDGPKGGLCNDESELIRSEPDCKEALEALGYGPLKKFWITVGSLLNPQIPAGCSIHAASSTPHLSTTSGAGRGREDLTPICSRNKGKGYKLVKRGHLCLSGGKPLPLQEGARLSVQQCADKCKAKEGCIFFIIGTAEYRGNCYQHKTPCSSCPGGWTKTELENGYDFYQRTDVADPPCPDANRQEIFKASRMERA